MGSFRQMMCTHRSQFGRRRARRNANRLKRRSSGFTRSPLRNSISLNTWLHPFVMPFVSLSWLWVALLVAAPAVAADAAPQALLKGVEGRYNRAKTLQVLFNETYTTVGRPVRTERGTLFLSKPGRMRWEYSEPQGKLFVSDGKDLWLFTPAGNRAEKMNLKETGDMRAPLAFLLGKLNFKKEFRNIRASAEGSLTRIAAEPALEDLPYTAVEFLVTSDSRIQEVTVTGYDRSVLRFTFDGEKVDPPLDGKLFRFRPPAGAEIVISEQ
jgi:outer membrane lipoprotein carrier protein